MTNKPGAFGSGAHALCGATRQRTGTPCRGVAMPNGRCRVHGGKSPGAPPGKAHWNYKDGHDTPEAREVRRRGRASLKHMKASGMINDDGVIGLPLDTLGARRAALEQLRTSGMVGEDGRIVHHDGTKGRLFADVEAEVIASAPRQSGGKTPKRDGDAGARVTFDPTEFVVFDRDALAPDD